MTPYREPSALLSDPCVVDLDDIRPGALIAWRKACAHLWDNGVTPLPPPHVVRALQRRGWWPC